MKMNRITFACAWENLHYVGANEIIAFIKMAMEIVNLDWQNRPNAMEGMKCEKRMLINKNTLLDSTG